jgi:TolB-like protein/Flp pilus assembly protein TadD
MPPIRQLSAILFSDIVGYTAMMQRDEADAVARVKRYREVLAERVAAHHGQILQHYGDGTLSIFPSAVEAAYCARAVQLALSQAPKVPLRMGIHIGDVVRDGDDLYGDGVNIASRVQSLAPPGAVLFTERVMEDIRNQPDLRVEQLGKFAFKNVAQPMKIYAMAGEGFASLKRSELRSIKGDAILMEAGNLRLRRSQWLNAVAGLLGVIFIGWLVFKVLPGNDSTADPSATLQQQPSIAVLPFEDFSPQHDQAFFGDGIAEEILNSLAQLEGLKVAGRTSSFSFRDQDTDLRSIGRRLGVAAVLEGSVRKENNRIRVTAQLVNVADGFHLWSQTYDRELDDLFTIQQEIARNVAGKLAGLLLPEPPAGAATNNVAAYEAYLRGKHLLSQRSDSLNQALAYLQQAVKLDPQFAPAYAGLSNAYLWMGWNNLMPSSEAFPKVRDYALTAMRYDTALAYSHALLGAVYLWYDWQWEAARIALNRAVTKNASEARAYLDLGWLAAIGGRSDEAIALMNQAVALDPLNLEYNLDLADITRMSGAYAKARQQAEAMQQIYPDNSEVAWLLGLIDYNEKRYSSALEHFRRSVSLSGDQPWAVLHYLMALARSGEVDQARKELASLAAKVPLNQNAPVELAMVYVALGDIDKALASLESARQQRANWLISIGIDPLWNELRPQPAFQALVQAMAFPK